MFARDIFMMRRTREMNWKGDLLVLLGAVLGGLLGHEMFFWLMGQGFYGLILPGGLCGLGAGVFRSRWKRVPILCGLLALGLGLFTEWRFEPFAADAGFGYFLLHAYRLRLDTLILIGTGTAIGFWVPSRRARER
jgi:hypothetical protein